VLSVAAVRLSLQRGVGVSSQNRHCRCSEHLSTGRCSASLWLNPSLQLPPFLSSTTFPTAPTTLIGLLCTRGSAR
jgi:hypothetical protein